MIGAAGSEEQNKIARELYCTEYIHLCCAKKCEVDRQILIKKGVIKYGNE